MDAKMVVLAGVSCAMCILLAANKAKKTKHVVLQPPQINNNTITSRIECIRPVRNEKFNISYDYMHGKHIFHNYGHGGGGWTLLSGSVKESLKLLAEVKENNHNIKDVPITVIGAGVMGLYTALCLVDLGYTVSVVAEKFRNLASHNAGGLLAPVSMKTSDESKPFVDRISVESFIGWRDIALGNDTRFRGCARFMPVYSSDTTDAGLNVYIKNKLVEPSVPVLVYFGNKDTTPKPMLEYNTIYMDPIIMMERLHALLASKNVNMICKKVNDFCEIESNVVFNCSGIGSKVLNKDKNLEKVYGHLLKLTNQPKGTQDYMVFTNVGDDYVYYIPKGEGIIGGTYISEKDYNCTTEDYQNRVQQAAYNYFNKIE